MNSEIMKGLENISPQEREFLYEVPVIITFLIAGSDNKIEDIECEWGQKLVEFRSQRNNPVHLLEYYSNVEDNWDVAFKKYEQKLEGLNDLETRNQYFSKELEELTPVLQRLPREMGTDLYNSFKTFARQIAEVSGGILGFGAVSPEEHRMVSLPMVKNPF